MIDLHLHLDGSLNPNNISIMAQMSGIELGYSEEELKKMLMVEPNCTNLGEYLEKFELPCVMFVLYVLLNTLGIAKCLETPVLRWFYNYILWFYLFITLYLVFYF